MPDSNNQSTFREVELRSGLKDIVNGLKCDHRIIYQGILDALKTNIELNMKNTNLFIQLKLRIDDLFERKMVTPFSAERPFKIVENIEDLNELNIRSADKAFVQKCIVFIMGRYRSLPGNGQTMALNIINEFFTDDFLTQCSWSGQTRKKNDGLPREDQNETKIKFKEFKNVIELFSSVLLQKDKHFDKMCVQSFFKVQLRNAAQKKSQHGVRFKMERKSKSTKCSTAD